MCLLSSGVCRAQQEEVNNDTLITIYLYGEEAEEQHWLSDLPGQHAAYCFWAAQSQGCEFGMVPMEEELIKPLY